MGQGERRSLERHRTRSGELNLAIVEVAGETHYELTFNGVFLMATYNAPSCRTLVDAVFSGISSRRNVSILIGGLGFGFSLRHALSHSGVQTVTVVELEPLVVEWNRKYLENEDVMDDPRSEVVVGDFYDYVQGSPRSYHGIAIDIDNGPDWIVREQNRRVYSLSMLNSLKTRLKPRGRLAVWSHGPNPSYKRALQEVFEEVHVVQAQDQEPGGRELESAIYVGRA
jgi:spermidine synthase